MLLEIQKVLMLRLLNAFKVAKEAGSEVLLSTCLVRDRVFSKEFELLCDFFESEEIPLYALPLAKLQ